MTGRVFVARCRSGRRKHTDPDCPHLQNAHRVTDAPASRYEHLEECPYCAGKETHGVTRTPMALRDRLLEADPDSIGGGA